MIPVTQPVEIIRIIPVTQIVRVTQVVDVTAILPTPTELAIPAPTEAPAATEAPIVSVIPSAAQAKLKNRNLLVWYDFQDAFTTSGLVKDRSGNGYDAQINGTISIVDGIAASRAILFYGDGYILTQSNPLAGRSVFSISLWFRTEHPENNYKLASAAWWNGGPGSGWIMGTHVPEFWSDDTGSLFLDGMINEENGFLSGTWNHEVVTYDGKRIKEYTNGHLINDWPSTGAAIGQGRPMAIGAWPQFGFNFEGSMDEFRIYSRSLTQNEVLKLYKQGS
jgi:hypothetical protein